MKKIYFFVAVCLFSCLNLYCDCEEVYPYDEYDYFPRRTVSSFTVDGGLDTIFVGRVIERAAQWKLVGATDYDWHSGTETTVDYAPFEANPDSMECGWFTVEKILEEDRSYLKITVDKNTSGRNHHAAVQINTSLYWENSINVYQDCK